MNKEYCHLINDYLCRVEKIENYGFYCITEEEFIQILKNIKPFESPDMYAITPDNLVILEHFEFDASKRTKKGMLGKREENELSKRIENNKSDEFQLEGISYDISFGDWIRNFEMTFDIHYQKINTYIENVRKQEGEYNKRALVGFIIEHQFCPIVNHNGQYHGELPYIFTKQFKYFFKKHNDVDFVLYIGYYNGKPQTIYIDRNTTIPDSEYTDLYDGAWELSSANKNEVVMFGQFNIDCGNV